MSFLDKDGYINTPEFIALVRDIDKLAVAEHLKPAEIYFSKKAIVRPDHPCKAKLDSAAFERKRAQPIKPRKRPPTSGSAVRMMVLLRNYKGLEEFDDYWKDYQLALKAIERHNLKASKSIAAIKAAATKKREIVNAAFDKNLDCFIEKVAEELELDYAIGTSMMGKTLIIKLPNGGYMSVGKADKERFLKAKEQEDAPAPAKKAVARKDGLRSAKSKPVAGGSKIGRAAKAKVGARSAAMKPALKQKTGRAPVKVVKKVRR